MCVYEYCLSKPGAGDSFISKTILFNIAYHIFSATRGCNDYFGCSCFHVVALSFARISHLVIP